MATGDQNDFLNRILADIPPWFGDPTTDTNLLAILNGFSQLASQIYSQFTYLKDQSRIKTATDINLDLISADYFAQNLPRGTGESDTQYLKRILNNLLAQQATRIGMYNTIYNITERAPRIIEPWRPLDCGGYSKACAGYSTAGAWSNTQLPYQAFIDVYRPNISSVPGVTGYTDSIGGYGVGRIAYTDTSQMTNQIFDAAILTAINNCKVYGTVVWVRLNN